MSSISDPIRGKGGVNDTLDAIAPRGKPSKSPIYTRVHAILIRIFEHIKGMYQRLFYSADHFLKLTELEVAKLSSTELKWLSKKQFDAVNVRFIPTPQLNDVRHRLPADDNKSRSSATPPTTPLSRTVARLAPEPASSALPAATISEKLMRTLQELDSPNHETAFRELREVLQEMTIEEIEASPLATHLLGFSDPLLTSIFRLAVELPLEKILVVLIQFPPDGLIRAFLNPESQKYGFLLSRLPQSYLDRMALEIPKLENQQLVDLFSSLPPLLIVCFLPKLTVDQRRLVVPTFASQGEHVTNIVLSWVGYPSLIFKGKMDQILPKLPPELINEIFPLLSTECVHHQLIDLRQTHIILGALDEDNINRCFELMQGDSLGTLLSDIGASRHISPRMTREEIRRCDRILGLLNATQLSRVLPFLCGHRFTTLLPKLPIPILQEEVAKFEKEGNKGLISYYLAHLTAEQLGAVYPQLNVDNGFSKKYLGLLAGGNRGRVVQKLLSQNIEVLA